MRKSLFTLLLLILCKVAFAQNMLTGTITDTNGEPLPGATLLLKEADRSTSTDADGFFIFTRLQKQVYTLETSYIGFAPKQQAISVDGRTHIEIELQTANYQTQPIIVSANRAGTNDPITHLNLDKPTLEKSNLGQDVPFLLRWTPSMVVTSDAGTGIGYTGIRLRGSDPTRINITINGIPLNDAESQGVFWVNLPDFTSSAQEVQIQRGVGTSTNGAGAFGGTINFNTLTKKEKAYGLLRATVGSFNTVRGNLQFGTGLLADKFTIDGRVSHIQSDGYIDRASADLQSFYASAAYWGDKSNIIFNVFAGQEVTYQAWNGVPAQLINTQRTFNTAGTERPGAPYDNEVDDYQQAHYQLFFNHQLTSYWYWRSAAHYTKGKGFFEQYKAQQLWADYGIGNDTSDLVRRLWLDNDFYGINTSLSYEKNRTHLQFGGAINNYEGNHFGDVVWTANNGTLENAPTYYDNDAEKLDMHLFGKINYRFDKRLTGFADMQYRHINYDFVGFDRSGSLLDQTATLDFFNPKLGLTYQFNKQNQIYAFAGVAHREPNRNDFVASSPNSRPQAERMIDYEVGFKHQHETSLWSANLYFMDYKDQLVTTGRLNDVGEYTRENVPDSYRLGLELNAQAQLHPSWGINANLTLSQNKIASFTEYIDDWDTGTQKIVIHEDTDIAFSPNVVFGSELLYTPFPKATQHDLHIALLAKYVGKQYLDNTSSDNARLDGYFFSDMRLKYGYETNRSFPRSVHLTFLARNIFDQLFSTNGWVYRFISEGYDPRSDDPYTIQDSGNTYMQQGLFPQAGRNFLLGVEFGF